MKGWGLTRPQYKPVLRIIPIKLRKSCKTGSSNGAKAKASLPLGKCFVSQWSTLRLDNSTFKVSRQPSAIAHNRGNHQLHSWCGIVIVCIIAYELFYLSRCTKMALTVVIVVRQRYSLLVSPSLPFPVEACSYPGLCCSGHPGR